MIAAVRVKGVPDAGKKHRRVLRSLKLPKKHNCMIYVDRESTKKALDKVKDYIAFGEIDKDTLVSLLRKRSDLEENLDESDYSSTDEVAEGLLEGDIRPKELSSIGVKLPFGLAPPSKGFSGTKKSHKQGGSLGNRGEDINYLLERMI